MGWNCHYWLLPVLLSLPLAAHAQQVEAICKPEILNFTKQTYRAYHQNWSIAQDAKSRFMYVANSKGLLEYDGSHWDLHELPNKQKVRSVATESSGRVYTGGLGEFGYWQPGIAGKLTYHSLKHLVPDSSFPGEEIWNILPTPQGVLFQSFAFIYLYRQNKVKKLMPPGNILFAHQVNRRILLEVLDNGLYELKGDAFVYLENSAFLGKESVNTILPTAPNGLLVGTSRGIYIYDGHGFREWNHATNEFIRQNQLNRGVLVDSRTYAFGTILNGIILTNAQGDIVQHINQKNGLQNNTVLSLCKDADGNLWSGMDKGIDLILVSSPFRYYTDQDGRLGTVYDVALHRGKLYLGTNQGLFFTELSATEADFKLVPKTQGQVWDLEVIDGQLLCGHNNGTFLIEDSKVRVISSVTGGWVIKKLKHHPDWLIQGTYTRLCVYGKDKNNRWAMRHMVKGFSAPVHQLEEDSGGRLWVNKAHKGISRIKLSANLQSVDSIQNYETPELKSTGVNLCNLNRQIIATTSRQSLVYQASGNRFVPAAGFQNQSGVQAIRKFFPVENGRAFVLEKGGELGFIEPGQLQKEIPVKKFQWFDDYENLVSIDSNHYLVCTENGFGLLPKHLLTQVSSSASREPLIRNLAMLDFPELNHTFRGNDKIPEFSFAYYQNSLSIGFSTPQYGSRLKYSYWLENSSKGWSSYQEIQQKEFNNLAPGKYVFRLRSALDSGEAALSFEIRQPWYWNRWSIIFYGLLAVTAGIFSYTMHLRRVKTHQDRVRKKLERKLRKQAEESRREIMRLRNEKLEHDVVRKSEELANSTMTLIKKNELLHQIRQEVLALKPDIGNQNTPYSYRQILQLIENNISSEHDWQVFESNFNRVHEEFLQKLINAYATLTPSDLKLAAYLRMNLSTKEIAQLFNITYRSVELKRYRLRKKMNLSTDVNLGEFMMKYTDHLDSPIGKD